jgi:hypothetical protein
MLWGVFSRLEFFDFSGDIPFPGYIGARFSSVPTFPRQIGGIQVFQPFRRLAACRFAVPATPEYV